MSLFIPYDKISPYIRYVNDLKRRGYSEFGERVIYDHELFFCVDGEASMYLEDKHYTIRRGDVFFLRPNLRNRMVVEKGCYFHAHCVHFDWYHMDESVNFTAEDVYMNLQRYLQSADLVERLKTRPNADVPELSFPPLIRGTDYDRLLTAFRGMYMAYRENTTSSNLRLRGLFFMALSEMMCSTDITYSSTEHSHRHMINKVIQYIDSHFSENISVPELSASVGMSGKYFGVVFKKVTGNTVNEYITRVRMEKAEELLLKTAMPLEDIASAIGVSDVYYLVKLFKKYKGITPGRYRRMLLYDSSLSLDSPEEGSI